MQKSWSVLQRNNVKNIFFFFFQIQAPGTAIK